MQPETERQQPTTKSPSEDDPGVKWCEYGQHYLPASTEHFGSNRAAPDGMASWCLVHSREYDRKRSPDHEAQKKRRKATHKATKKKRGMATQIAGMNDRAKRGGVIPHVDEIMEEYWGNITPKEFGKLLAEETKTAKGMGFQKNADLVIRATGQVTTAGMDNTDNMTDADIERILLETLEGPQLAEETAGPEFAAEDEPAEQEINDHKDDDGEVSIAS